MSSSSLPLCVDCDGTLVRTDTLWESIVLLLKKRPFSAIFLPLWAVQGKPALKKAIAKRVTLDPATLPYHDAFLAFLLGEHSQGRELLLVTAADESIAQSIAAHLGIFSRVIGTSSNVNLSGEAKARELVSIFGERGFAYAGNESRDVFVWRHAAEAIVVQAGPSLIRRAKAVTEVTHVFADTHFVSKALLRGCRPHQWLKNLLIFVPIFTAHMLQRGDILLNAVQAFVAFSLCTSCVYWINDVLDLQADRKHPYKRNRPLASGAVTIPMGLSVAFLCLLGSIALSLFLPPFFFVVLSLYFILTLLYSFILKQIAVVDVLLLAGLYTIRIVAGHAATGVAYSFWLFLFSIFFFLSLALMKRYSELLLPGATSSGTIEGRGYSGHDKELVAMLGTTSGLVAVLVLALYINSSAVVPLYSHPELLWALCPLLMYWVGRIWLLTHRGSMHSDPILFTVRDPMSFLVGALIAGVLLLAS